MVKEAIAIKINEQLLDYINGLEIIDTHEHLPPTEDSRDKEADILSEYLSHYSSTDLCSAGLSRENYQRVVDKGLPLLERWELIAPYWRAVRFTGYSRALRIAAKDLYGIDHIGGDTIEELNRRFQASIVPGRFHTVLRERSKIKKSLVILHDYPFTVDEAFFKPVLALDTFLVDPHTGAKKLLERNTGMTIYSFSGWLEAVTAFLKKVCAEQKHPMFKMAIAYMRTLAFDTVDREAAEALFELPGEDNDSWHASAGKKPLQDYLMHHILSTLEPMNVVVQFHTGIQEGNNYILDNSNPLHLNNLISQYRDVRFDLFHMGYPYQKQLEGLVKIFSNAYLNMCWAHIISPADSIKAFGDWIETLPMNKILAFGGDYLFLDGTYAHQKMARENIAAALTGKIDDGILGLDDAKEIARWVFCDNPAELYGIE